jgi:hypothetical protein
VLLDASPAAGRLYGKATVDADELRQVVREGIREWPQWQRSLEDLAQQDWT